MNSLGSEPSTNRRLNVELAWYEDPERKEERRRFGGDKEQLENGQLGEGGGSMSRKWKRKRKRKIVPGRGGGGMGQAIG